MQNDWQGYAQPQKPNTDKVAQLGWEQGLPGTPPQQPPFQFPPVQLPPGMGVWNTPGPEGVAAFPPLTVPPIQPPVMTPEMATLALAQAQPQASDPAAGEVIWVVVKIARMDRGEFVFVASEAAFRDRDKAHQYAASKGQKNWWEKVMGVDCWCERGVHETVLHFNI